MPAPPLSDDITASALDTTVRRDLRGLQKDTAETVALHLVAAGTLVDEDPLRALEHARYARQRASRIAVVREAAGIAAYHAGEWSEALGDLRAARRMGSGPGHLAVMADIERALGRPERALELARDPEAGELGPDQAIELSIVAAGARRDLGELDAAVVALQVPELDPARRDPWSARLFYAYADNLLAAGRESEAVQWFVHAADADDDGQTDAGERLAELTGEPVGAVLIEDVEEPGPGGSREPVATAPASAGAAGDDQTTADAENLGGSDAAQPRSGTHGGAAGDTADDPDADGSPSGPVADEEAAVAVTSDPAAPDDVGGDPAGDVEAATTPGAEADAGPAGAGAGEEGAAEPGAGAGADGVVAGPVTADAAPDGTAPAAPAFDDPHATVAVDEEAGAAAVGDEPAVGDQPAIDSTEGRAP